MPRPTNIRQPVSCEPCRKRKIRCSRTRVPCEACQRRGCSSQCTYQRPHAFTSDRLSTGSQSSSPPQSSSDDLVNRIRNLETLLQKSIDAQSSNAIDQQNSAAPLTASSFSSTGISNANQYRPFGSLGSLPPSPDSLTGLPYTTGTLDVSENGYARYEPRSSQWTSVLANLSIQASLEGEAAKAEDDVGSFPFMDSPVKARRELVGILPPMRYCDQLKDVYFIVFSPVGRLVRYHAA